MPNKRQKAAPPRRVYTATLIQDGPMCAIPVPFDPKETFGKVRAPVKVTLNGFTYRSTIAAMGGPYFIPLRKSNREAAGLEGHETVEIVLTLDTEQRVVTPPADLAKALRIAGVWERWSTLSFTHQREHAEAVEGAKAAETRARRIQRVVTGLSAPAQPKR